MPNFGAEDVPAQLEDMGVEISFVSGSGAEFIGGGDPSPTVKTKGLVDREGRRELGSEMGFAGVIGTHVMVTIQTGSLPGLKTDMAILVDGVEYQVTSMVTIEDGELTEVTCRKRMS